jgi:hypothetical protein
MTKKPDETRPTSYKLRDKSLMFIEGLHAVPWFGQVGEPLDTTGVRYPADLRVAKRLCFSKSWDNTLTASGNQLTFFLAQNHSNLYDTTWNEIVDACTPLLMPIIGQAADAGVAKLKLRPAEKKVLFMTLRRQLVHACHELEYEDVMQGLLCLQLIPWYRAGHWPCGYQGTWPEGVLVVY